MAEVERCTPWLQAALDRGGNTHTVGDVAKAICSGHMQLWPAERAVAVTEILVYPRKKVLHIFLAGGDMEQIVDMEASAAEFARLHGCNGMSIAGRRGWAKVLAGHGYTPELTTLTRGL